MPQIYPNSGNSKRGNARLPKLFVVELTVGEKVFHSEGRTRQQAKHQAAKEGKNFEKFFFLTMSNFDKKSSFSDKKIIF